MTVFRDYDDMGKDRSAEDRRRHRELVEDAIKKNIGEIIAEESIIGQRKDKKIKIPIKGIKEYRFIYGKNKAGVISGRGQEKRGDRVNKPDPGEAIGDKAGNQEGEDIYETEITIEDLVKYLFEDIDLPYMQRKKMSQLETEATLKKSGYKKKGIQPRLAKKKTVIEKIKRKKAYYRSNYEFNEGDRFPFHNEDLRYYRVKEKYKKESNAVCICIMDTSGSMNQTKKYLARSFYFLLYQFLQMKYEYVDIVFISHTTTAREVTEDEFFHKGESGGTYISSGYEKALEIIEQRYNPEHWNIYCFHCSDGDNWDEDNEKAEGYAHEICKICNLFGYGEIKPDKKTSTIYSLFSKNISYDNFAMITIADKEDIWPSFKKLLEGEEQNGV